MGLGEPRCYGLGVPRFYDLTEKRCQGLGGNKALGWLLRYYSLVADKEENLSDRTYVYVLDKSYPDKIHRPGCESAINSFQKATESILIHV